MECATELEQAIAGSSPNWARWRAREFCTCSGTPERTPSCWREWVRRLPGHGRHYHGCTRTVLLSFLGWRTALVL